MQRHEREEFSYHERIEEHMGDTKSFIAQSGQHRQDVSSRVSELEVTTRELIKDVEALKTRMTVMFSTLLPVAGWAIWQLIDHFRVH
jgi:phage-related protein